MSDGEIDSSTPIEKVYCIDHVYVSPQLCVGESDTGGRAAVCSEVLRASARNYQVLVSQL